MLRGKEKERPVGRAAPDDDAIEAIDNDGNLREATGKEKKCFLTGALAWAARGIPVFPCRNTPGEDTHKAPHTPSGFHDATTDEPTIRAWAARWPHALIGMPTGPASGYDIIDIDVKKGRDGRLWVRDWERRSPVQSFTVNDGIHLWFRSDGTLSCRNNLFDGVDLKGSGGYVIVAPSDGYRWAEGKALGDLTGDLEAVPGDLRPKPYERDRSEPRERPEGEKPDIEKIKAALRAVDADCDRTTWTRIGFALYNELGDDGEELWIEWSQTSNKWRPSDAKQWRSFDKYPDVTIATLFHLANEAEPNWYASWVRSGDPALDEALAAEAEASCDPSEPQDEPKAEPPPKDEKAGADYGAKGKNGASASGRYHDKWELDCVRVADVEPKRIDWLWEGRIALGKLTVIAGNPGANKSTAILDLVARITRGKEMPCNEGNAPMGNVLILTNEDDVADTIHPRLAAAGADVERVYVIKGLVQPDKSGRRTFNLMDDVERLKVLVEKIGDVVAIVIDPVSAYLGKPGGKQDAHRDLDVRAILSPLQDLAAESGLAIIGISHLSKGGSTEALMRVMGSIATVAAARATYLIAKDKDPGAERRRLFLPVKNNLGDDIEGFAFTVREKSTGYDQPAYAVAVDWEDKTVKITADEAMAPRDGRASDDLENAKEIIRGCLANGPALQSDVEDALTAEDIGRKSGRNARAKLGVKSRRRAGGGKNGPWEWFWPEGMEVF